MTSDNGNRIRVLIVDDHTILRAGLRMLVEDHPNMAVVAEAGNRGEALASASSHQPDIILLDLDLNGESSIEFLPELLTVSANSRVLILTGVRDPEVHRRAIRRGAMGLLLKDQATDVLVKAIEKVNAGEVWLDRSMTASVLTEIARDKNHTGGDADSLKIATLTPREREVIRLIGLGLRNKELARRLFVSEATVRNHLTSIFSKLEVSDRFELAIYAFQHNLAKPPC
jgi:two-component system, NarL family, nitrate/nitrite response regulator NarL